MQIVPSICIHSRPAGAGKINGRIYFPKSTIFPWKVNNISFKTEQHFLRKLNCPFILAKSHKLCDLARLSDTWCSVYLSHREQFPGIFIYCKVDNSVQPDHMWINWKLNSTNYKLYCSVCPPLESQYDFNLILFKNRSILHCRLGQSRGEACESLFHWLSCLYIISAHSLAILCQQHRLMKSYTFICVTFSRVFEYAS